MDIAQATGAGGVVTLKNGEKGADGNEKTVIDNV